MVLALLLALAAPPKGHWSDDATHRLSGDTLRAFDAVAQKLDDSGLGQLGLLVVSSTHGEQPRAFATAAFDQWHLGHPGRGDGLLLFFALDDRKSEIIFGRGYPQGTSLTTDRIMRDDVVAHMKQGRLDDAVLHATASLGELATRVFGERAQAVEATPLKERSPRGWTVDLDYALTPEESAALDREGDAVYASGKGLLFFAPYAAMVDTASLAERLRQQLHRDDVWVVFASMPEGGVHVEAPGAQRLLEPIDRVLSRVEVAATDAMRGEREVVFAAIRTAVHDTAGLIVDGPPPKSAEELIEEHQVAAFSGLGVTGMLGLVSVRSWLRRRPRSCSGCGNPRHRLNEETDDPHLTAGQVLEEQLGSVDYDVWWCGRCNDALVLRYGAVFTRFSACKSCGFKTMSSSSRTLIAATYDHGGTVEVTETCRGCPHVNTYTRHTARLTRDTDSSSSSWSSSSSSSSSSSAGGGSSGSW
ncbi:MAG: TPM domain-containing protein [Archangiaceae bacterium]|nr:TPM domain-containing protein [Archangiaceae bacterium]